MLTKDKIKELVEYRKTSAEHDKKDVEILYKNKRYSSCLFFCHLILEKALKALVAQNTQNPAPKTHHLKYLCELAGIALNTDEQKLLGRANEFNMEARYPEERQAFYKLCDRTFADKFYTPILSFYKKLCQKIN